MAHAFDDQRASPEPDDHGRSLAPRDQRTEAAPDRATLTPAETGQPAGYPNFDQSGDDLAATLMFYLRIVLKRKFLIVGCALLALTIGALITFMQTPLYQASVRIQIDSKTQDIVGDEDSRASSVGSSSEFLRTQYELLKSRSLAERVVSLLQLQHDEAFLAPRSTSVIGSIRSALAEDSDRQVSPIALQARATSIVKNNVAIRPVPGSRLVDIVFTDPDPGRAQRVADAYADAYVASNLDKRFQANAYAKTFLEDQIKQLKLRLEESEKALLEFAEREQIVQTNEQASIAENNLAAANTTLGQLVTERIRNEQLWKQVSQSDGIDVPQLLTNSVIDGLRARRKTLETEYKEKLETFKPDYPEMQEISSKIREIDRQLKSEVETIEKSLKAAYEASAEQEADMRERIDELRAEVLSLQRRSVQHGILEREVKTNRNLYNSLLQRLREVDVASGVGTNNVFVVDRAQRPGAPSQPRLGRALALALVLGLGVGLGSAYLLEILDDRVRVPEEVEQLTGLSTLGIIPEQASADAFADSLEDPRSPVSEAYRSLATALQFSTESGLPRSLVLTSAGPGEGKSSTAVAIAQHFATLGMRVLLVDGDLRKPSLHTKLELDNSIGLSNYLTGAMTPPETFQATGLPNVTLMASGPIPPNAADLLGGTRMFSLISVGLEAFDLIVIDGPPMLGLADAQLLSSAGSATLFVVASGRQRKGNIVNALRRLSISRSRVVGSVLTRFDAKSAGYGYGYGYGYSYSTSYGSQAYSYGVDQKDKDRAALVDTRSRDHG